MTMKSRLAGQTGLAWRGLLAFAMCALITTRAEGATRIAAGATEAVDGAPTASATQDGGSQQVTYRFSKPSVFVAADGIADISMAGVENFADAGAPSLPVMAVRIAIPQGKTVAGARVMALSAAPVATGVTLRHAERQVRPMAGAFFASTPRNEDIYGSDATYPAEIGSEGHVAYKNGVAFYELVVTPVFYKPVSGEVGYYPEIVVSLEFASTVRRSFATAGGADDATMPFVPTEARRAAVAELVDNPAVVSSYAGQTRVRGRSSATAPLEGDDEGTGETGGEESSDEGDEENTIFKKPTLPCTAAESYQHVVISSGTVADAARALVMYRRKTGTTSTLVTVADIMKVYAYGGDTQAMIREFIRDAYKNWGTEYVVLAGDTTVVPVRLLYGEAGGDVGSIPSDLYYQCLDGDFDGNGNGIYGELDDGPDGGMPDLYAEVKIGRVSAQTPEEFRNWFSKMLKYDEDVAARKPYTRGSLFAAEYAGPYDWCISAPLMEQIRQGTSYRGLNDGYEAYGFMDVPDLFDEESMQTLYDKDSNEAWDGTSVVAALNTGAGVSVINHMGHSSPSSNMRLSISDVDGLVNENPFFVYSQGCDAGAFDKDCIAEHFTTSTKFGAFAGVWNSRYGWYSYNETQLLPSGSSQRYQRRFWDAVFRDGHRELGYANMLSHERNAANARSGDTMLWCYYETTLFGDPMQQICGPENIVTLDREAYRTDGTMAITYTTATRAESFTATVTAYVGASSDIRASVDINLPFAYTVEGVKSAYTNSLAVADLGVEQDDVIIVTIVEEPAGAASAYIDDIPPVFTEVSLRNTDVGVVAANWTTDEETLCAYYMEDTAPFENPDCHEGEEYATAHSLTLEDVAKGLYYVRILAEDKAGNTNVWNSADPTATVAVADKGEYGIVMISDRAVRAAWDMERDTAGWTTDNPDCWQLGTPTYGPENASRCWGTVLNGRYFDGANASLVSPAVSVRSTPAIVFRHWHSILETPSGLSNNVGADYGAIEVMAIPADSTANSGSDGVWINAAQFASAAIEGNLVRGESDGWETVRILLPADFENKNIRIRFRFVSDDYPASQHPEDYPAAGVGNPAGWYVDGVQFLDVPNDPGTIISAVPADGSEVLYVKPGETTSFKLETFNVGSEPIIVPAGGASLSVAASGVAAGAVTLDNGSPAPATYGTIGACATVPAAETFSLTVAPTVPVGTAITLSQTINAAGGQTFSAATLVRVVAPTAVSGTVLQPTGAPVVNATVTVSASDANYTCVTDANGEWEIGGLATNSIVRVAASYGLAKTDAIANSPDDSVALELPLAEMHLSTNEIVVSALVTNYPGGAALSVNTLTIANTFDLAALDGNVGPSENLTYSITGYLDDNEEELPWFHLESSPFGSIAPGASDTIAFSIVPSAADPTAGNTVRLEISGNGWNSDVETVTITLDAWDDIQLLPAGTEGTDIPTVLPETAEYSNLMSQLAGITFGGITNEYSLVIAQTNDRDGTLESGEYGLLTFKLRNPSEYEEISLFEGTVTATGAKILCDDPAVCDPAVTNFVGANVAVWKGISPLTTSACMAPVPVIMEGATANFLVSGWAYHNSSSNWQEIAFTVVNESYTAVTGAVQAVNFFPAEPLGATNLVPFARITATDATGNVHEGNFSSAIKSYLISGLVPGTKYWLHAEVPLNSTAVLPFGHLVTVSDENFAENIIGRDYGAASGHLALSGVLVDDTDTGDGDDFIDCGETIRIYPELFVDSSHAVNGIRAKLTLPDAFERPDCMAIVAGKDEVETGTETIWSGNTAYLLGEGEDCFEVTVDANAVDGDYQRFLLEVWEDTQDAEPKHWFFDFALVVTPRFSLGGTALTAGGDAVEGVELSLTGLDAGSEVSEKIVADSETGEFVFFGLPAGQYEVAVTALPEGYLANPAAVTNTLTAADILDIAIALDEWGLSPDGDGYDPAGGTGFGAISLTVPEGQATNATFSLTANSGGGDIEVKIVYDRTTSEVLTRADIERATASARASLAATLGSDWTALDPESFSDTEFEFVFKDGTTVAERDAFLARRGLAAKYHFKTIPASIAVPGATTASLASAALANAPQAFAGAEDSDILVSVQPAVKGAGANAFVPDDTLYPEQWALSNRRQTGGTFGVDIGAPAAWNYAGTTGSRDVLVAVTDTGIAFDHPDLADNWSGLGWNYVDDSPNCSDNEGHGTHVAGIIGAVGGNGFGVCGVNWQVSLMSQRVSHISPSDGRKKWATSAEIARSYEDSYLAGAAVNNNSWGGPFYSDILFRTMKKAQEYGMLFVCAAGNEGVDLDVTPTYPASYAQLLDNVIVVAATDHDGYLASFSNWSSKHVHLAAPGEGIISTGISQSNGGAAALAGGVLADPGNYVEKSGTSMASPYVAGAAAFLKAVSPNSSYGFIRDAILNGVRVDPLLADYVSTSGHLDLEMSTRLLGANWLRFGTASDAPLALTTNITVAAGQTVSLPLLVNDAPILRAGAYSATIKVAGDASLTVPVTLTVTPAPIAEIASCDVVAEENEDGIHAYGEEVTLAITLRNTGSTRFRNVTAKLCDANGTAIAGAEHSYGYLGGLSTTLPGEFTVTLPSTGTVANFRLLVFDNGAQVADLPVEIPLFTGTVLAVNVTDASGAAVEGAEVELLGSVAACGTTGADGVAKLAVAAGASACTLRVTADGFARHEDDFFDPTVATATVALSNATLEPAANVLALRVPVGMSLATNLAFSATTSDGAPLEVTLALAPRAKVAVFDDRDDSAFLVSRLRNMGFDVSYFPENYIYAVYNHGAKEDSEIVQAPRYTWDDAAMLPYDAIIAIPSGVNGTGRRLAPVEQDAYETFVNRGGRLIFSGVTPLASPDNMGMAGLVGFTADACSVVEVAATAAVAGTGCPGAPFVELSSGDLFASDSGEYDSSLAATFVSGECLAEADDANAPVAKIYVSDRNELGGQILLWNGNATGWQRDGAALDILRGYLYEEFYEGSLPEWLSISGAGTTLSVASGSEGTLAITANANRSLGAGTYEASLLMVAPVDGAQCVPVTVSLTVEPPEIRAFTSGAVTDAGGRLLKGDGSDGSCLLQLIYAGADGIPDAPAADGSTTGDDIVLAASHTFLRYARFGSGIATGSDSGQFDVFFDFAFEGYAEGADVKLYVRAWDGSSFDTSVLYGDSEVATVTFTDGAPDAIDFGSWSLSADNVVVDALYDGNGDGLPDAWTVANCPEIDPQAAPSPLDTVVSLEGSFNTTPASVNSSAGAGGNPVRAFATDKFVFVLEKYTHRIAVHDRATGTNLFYYGAKDVSKKQHWSNANAGEKYTDTNLWAPGTGDGGFKLPRGLALDVISGQNRFAVADTENNRIQLFDFDPDTGDITFVSAYGTKSSSAGTGAAAGTFTQPYDVAFAQGGDLLVADTGNRRVARVNFTANSWSWVGTFNFTDKDTITGIAYGEDESYDCFWVANTGNERQRVSFHRMAPFSADPVAYLGSVDAMGANSGEFNAPADVKFWTVGSRTRIVAADTKNSRIRILDPVADDSGCFTGLVAIADVSRFNDAASGADKNLWLPEGVFPVDNDNVIFVADTGNNKVKWFSITMDQDGDGLDDFWEDMNGLDSTIEDTAIDSDGDGLSDYAELIVGSDPNDPDTDGDGYGDGYELLQGNDPLDAEDVPDEKPVAIPAISADPVELLRGDEVVITATFASPAYGPASYALYDGNGDLRASGNLEFSEDGLTASNVVDTASFAAGVVSGTFTFVCCDPTTAEEASLFTVIVSDEENYEEVGFHIDSFNLAGNGAPIATIGWTVPSASLPSDGRDLEFRIDYRSSLTTGDWDKKAVSGITGDDPIKVGQTEAGKTFTYDINLSTFQSPSGFFRLRWLNKVKNLD